MIPAAAALLLLVLQLCSEAASAQAGGGAGLPPSCPTRCGNVSVPYPFGIGVGCSLEGFALTCHRNQRLLLGDGSLQVVEISLADATLRAMNTAGAVNLTYDGGGNGTWGGGLQANNSPFIISERRNHLVVTGCNIQVTLVGDVSSGNIVTVCSSFCSISDRWPGAVLTSPKEDGDAACSGIGCCETPIPFGRPAYGVVYKNLDETHELDGQAPTAVRIAEQGWFDAWPPRC